MGQNYEGFTSLLGLLNSQPICLRSGIALEASWRAAVVRTARAECKVLNHAAASDASLALNTQLCTASGLCSSSVRPSIKQILLLVINKRKV